MLPYSAYSDSRLTPLARAYTHQRVTGVGVDSAGRRFDSQYPASGESEIADVLPAYDDKDGPPRYQEALVEVHISGPSPPMVSDTPIAHAEPRDMISSHSNANANYQRCVPPFSQSMISSDVYPADKIKSLDFSQQGIDALHLYGLFPICSAMQCVFRRFVTQ